MVLATSRRDHDRMSPTDHAEGPLLVCYDGSEDAKHAIESAASLIGNRQALIATVWQPFAGMESLTWSGTTASGVNFVELDHAAAEGGARTADDGVRIAREAGLDAEPVTEKSAGPVWKTILELADRHDAAAIVMGCRGFTGIRSVLLGSTSSAVVHHADRPTLVVHRPNGHDGHQD
jgi:nucleotide-binding universal stress UspA family protein